MDKGISRREFLKSTALTMGAFAAHSTASQLSGPNTSAANVIHANTDHRAPLSEWEYRQGSLGGIWDLWRNDESETILWQKIQLPHCFNAHDAVDPDRPYYEGAGWYRTKIISKNPFPHGYTFLHFEGAGQKSAIFANLNQVGQHLGGYDEFVVDISEAANHPGSNGEIPIAVRCDNSRDLDTIPSDLNDFPRYGGLYRPVSLVYIPAISLERVHIHVAMESLAVAEVSIRARLYNPKLLVDDVQLLIKIYDQRRAIIRTFSRKLKCWKDEQEVASFKITSPQMWSPTSPSLYHCEMSIVSPHGVMNSVESFGCRYFEFIDHGPFKLNGERLLLRGTHREEDHALLGAAMPGELIAQEMRLIKDLGANFIRLGHHQQSTNVLRLCDELGLLVWEEIPWSRGGLGDESYQQEARNMLQTMIDEHYNHPSVIIWGLGNELDWPGDFAEFDKKKIRDFVSELNELTHTLDSTRKTAVRRCEFCSDITDLYSPSIWAGWYHDRYTRYKQICEQEMKKVPHFIQMEWGGENHAGRHAEDADRLLLKAITGQYKDETEHEYLLSCGQDRASVKGDWSETYLCNLLDWHLKEQETMPWLTGSAQWIFKDFATPLRSQNPIPHVNEKGLVQRDLTLKEGYFVFQSYWSEKPMIHIYGHSWPIRWGDEQEEKLVKVYSNCEQAELFLNNISCGVRKRNSQDFPAAGLHWPVKFKNGGNHLRAVGQKKGMTVVDELRFQYQTEKWQRPVRLDLKEMARLNGIATVEAKVYDSNNVLCLDARNQVRFELAGDGVLLDNTGTVTGSRVVELSNGSAEISLKINNGTSSVSVSCDGLPTMLLAVV